MSRVRTAVALVATAACLAPGVGVVGTYAKAAPVAPT